MQNLILQFSSYWQKIRNIIQFTSHDISTLEGKSNERYRRIIITGGLAALVKISSALISLITVPLTLNYLGAERYGLWMAISSITTIMTFADLGLGNGLLNAISKANGKKSILDAQFAVSSSFFILLGISIFLLIIFISIYPFISWQYVFNVKSTKAINEAGPALLVFFITFVVNLPLGVIKRIQDGYQEGYKFQIWLLFGSLLSLCGVLICIYLNASLPWLILSFSSGQIIATALNGIVLFQNTRKHLKPRLCYFNLRIGKKIINTGIIFFLLGLFTLLANYSDNLIIAQTLGASSVSGYEILKKLFMFTMFTQFLIQPLWPAFGEALESGDINWVKSTYKKGTKLTLVSGILMGLPILLLGKIIIKFWVGEEFIPSWALLVGFYIYVVINNYIGVVSTLLNSSKIVGKLIIPLAFTAIFSIIFKILLSNLIGLSGIIWTTIIVWSICYIIPSYYLSRSLLEQSSKSSL